METITIGNKVKCKKTVFASKKFADDFIEVLKKKIKKG